MPHARPTLFLLDANALLHRAWHAIPPLTSPSGMIVNAAYGMASVALKMQKEESPDLFIACWDTAAPTFRHEKFEDYKAQREEKEQELYDQIPVAQEVLEAIGIASIEMDGYEADDLIATLAVRGVNEGYDVRIVTGDRDTLQLVNDHIHVIAFKKGVSETKVYDADAIKEEYGIAPDQMIDWKAIKGDPSDNIPGIKGIGDKGATELIQAYGNLDKIFKAAKDKKSAIKEGMRKKLIEGEADGRQALDLVTVKTDVPIKESFNDLRAVADRERFVELAGKYGFRSLIARFDAGKGGPTGPTGPTGQDSSLPSRPNRPSRPSSKKADSSNPSEIKGDRIVLHVMRAPQDSLFGSAEASLVVADEKACAAIPFSEVKKSKKDVTALLGRSIVCHDAKSLMRELESVGIDLGAVSHDTLLAAYLLSAGERSYDLDALALQELGKELPLDVDRACDVAAIIREIADRQRAKMDPEGMTAFMERFELPLTPILRKMERTGICIDIPYLAKLSKEMQAVKAKLEAEMEKAVGHPFNPGSPSQLATILFDELKLPSKGIKRGKTGYSTAASELEKLDGAHPIIALIGDHREIAKLLSTYVETLPTQADKEGRVHTTFNQAIASTGRLSSSDPNLQNIPVRSDLGKKIRRAFIASDDLELLSCDYSQIELRVVAALAKDKNMLAAFESGADIHTSTAAAIWGIDPAAVTKEQRRAAKAINFGIIYGQGPQGLAVSAGIPFAEAKEFIAKYFETYTGIKEFLETTKALARERGYVETLFGRRRPTPDILSGVQPVRAAAERMAINMPVQGTSADLLKLAMIEVAKGLPKVCADARMLLQVHDELLFEVPSSEISNVATYVKDVMEHIEKIGCPIVVDAKRGKNWEEMRPVVRS